MNREGAWEQTMARLSGGLLLCTLLVGCAFVRGNYGDEFNIADVAAIQKGVSTRADVTARLGAPDRIVGVNGHEVYQYYRYDLKSGTILFFSRTNVKSDDLYVMFDPNGVVNDVVFGRRTDGLSFQFWPFGD